MFRKNQRISYNNNPSLLQQNQMTHKIINHFNKTNKTNKMNKTKKLRRKSKNNKKPTKPKAKMLFKMIVNMKN